MPHLDAAWNLARWLAGNDHDAEDIVQEASMRAFRFGGSFRGGSSRSWLLAIVRNTAYTWLKKNRPKAIVSIEDEEMAEIEDPGAPAFAQADGAVLRAALEEFPWNFAKRSCCATLKDFPTRKSPKSRMCLWARSCPALPARASYCKTIWHGKEHNELP